MTDSVVKWTIRPILAEHEKTKQAEMRDLMYGRDMRHVTEVSSDERLVLQSGLALVAVGGFKRIKSFLDAMPFSSVIGRGTGSGLACTIAQSHMGLAQIGKIAKGFAGMAVKHPGEYFRKQGRQMMSVGVEYHSSTFTMVQLFQCSAVNAMRDDLLFFRDGDLAIDRDSLGHYASDAGYRAAA